MAFSHRTCLVSLVLSAGESSDMRSKGSEQVVPKTISAGDVSVSRLGVFLCANSTHGRAWDHCDFSELILHLIADLRSLCSLSTRPFDSGWYVGLNCTLVPSFFVASSSMAFVDSLPLSEVMVEGHPKIGIHLSVIASVTESCLSEGLHKGIA